ncbi:MAG TPA: DUF1648 domain-containing protein [Chthoniobacter sp.]|nr:DUF1648 domain-containing protein [Chthoniobacter sp.]
MKPKSSLQPYVLLALAWLAFAAYVWWSSAQLPERVATHFGANGLPNGWETHSGYLQFTLIFGAVVPAFVIGLFAIMRLANGWGLNIPHKDYWLAPERRAETMGFIQRQGTWFALLLVAFFAVIHSSILGANAQAPASLSPTSAIWIGGGFLAAAGVWVALFISYFFRKRA